MAVEARWCCSCLASPVLPTFWTFSLRCTTQQKITTCVALWEHWHVNLSLYPGLNLSPPVWVATSCFLIIGTHSCSFNIHKPCSDRFCIPGNDTWLSEGVVIRIFLQISTIQRSNESYYLSFLVPLVYSINLTNVVLIFKIQVTVFHCV